MNFFTPFGGSEGKGTINITSYEQSANGVWLRHSGFKNQLVQPSLTVAGTKPPAVEPFKTKPPKYDLSILQVYTEGIIWILLLKFFQVFMIFKRKYSSQNEEYHKIIRE